MSELLVYVDFEESYPSLLREAINCIYLLRLTRVE
jgi:hypothetical protein